MEDLADLVPAARDLAAKWPFSLRLQLGGGPAATLVSPGDGTLRVHRHGGESAKLVLRFFSAGQLNRTFLNQKALPPIPTGGFWRVAQVGTFTKLARELDAVLQPAPGALEDPAFLERHVRLLFKVLVGAIPVIAEGDPVSRHTLAHTPEGTARICLPALDLSAWARWAQGRMTAGVGEVPGGRPADVVITFTDRATADAALLGGSIQRRRGPGQGGRARPGPAGGRTEPRHGPGGGFPQAARHAGQAHGGFQRGGGVNRDLPRNVRLAQKKPLPIGARVTL